jgi:hypothetical protein
VGRHAILSSFRLHFIFGGRGDFSLGRVWTNANAAVDRVFADVEGEGRFYRARRVERNGGMRTRRRNERAYVRSFLRLR